MKVYKIIYKQEMASVSYKIFPVISGKLLNNNDDAEKYKSVSYR
jgi:hypothetical protein